MAGSYCRSTCPAILVALVVIGSAQAPVEGNELVPGWQGTSLDACPPQDPGVLPEPPKNLTVSVSCKNEAYISWKYKTNPDKFLATICPGDQVQCYDQEIGGRSRHHSFNLSNMDVQYKILLRTYINSPKPPKCSGPATVQFSSYPEVPDVQNLTLTPLNYSAILATWEKQWDYEIKFTVCTTKGLCKTSMVQGTLLQHTFDGLAPYTVYRIFALYQVTRNNRTCRGPQQSRTTQTFPKPPGPVLNLKYEIVNGVLLNAIWNAPNGTKRVDGYTIECKDIQGDFEVARNVSGRKSLVNVTLPLVKFSSTFNCSVWAFINFYLCGRVNGTETVFEVTTSNMAPGIVRELKHQIMNGIILMASWKSPEVAKYVKGYTISCLDWKTKRNVTTDVETLGPLVKVTLNLHEPVGEFECSVWAYNKNKVGQRAPGPKTPFQVTTDGVVPPRNVKLVRHTATSLTYTWTADPTATGWNITIVAEGAPAYNGIPEYSESNSTSVTHNITKLTPWTTYNVSIVNCRPSFCSEPTFVKSTTDVAAPSTVRDLKYYIVDNVGVLLSWKKPERPNGPIDGYSVFVFNEDQKEGRVYDVEGGLTIKKINLKYQFSIFNISIEAYNVDKDSNMSIGGPLSEVQFETFGKGPMPPRPKFRLVTEDGVHLSWKMPDDPRFNINAFNVSVSHRRPFITSERNFNITNLKPWTDYNVSVSSCTNATECGQERNWPFQTDVGDPSEPLDLKVGSASTHWLLVEWKEPEVRNGPLSGYNISFKKDRAEVQETTTQLSYNLTGMIAGTTYEVSVYAFNDGRATVKRGKAATVTATTVSEKTSTTTILLAIFIPVITLLALMAGILIYKKYQKSTGERETLVSQQGWDDAQ